MNQQNKRLHDVMKAFPVPRTEYPTVSRASDYGSQSSLTSQEAAF